MKNIIPRLVLGCALLLQSGIACTSTTETPTPTQVIVPTPSIEPMQDEPTDSALDQVTPQAIPTALSNLEIGIENLNRIEPIYSIQAAPGWVYNLAFSPDGSLLTGSVQQDEIQIWDAADGRLLKTLYAHSAQIMNVAFSSDGELFASSSIDHTILLWRVSNWEPIQRLEGHTSFVNSLAFSPDNRLLASGGEDRILVVWSVESGEILFSSDEPILGVKDVAFSPDGTKLATASGETRVRVWDTGTWELQLTLLGPSTQYRLAFSPDGSTLATAPWSINAETWEPLSPIVFWNLSDGSRAGTSEVTTVALSLAYSNDGSLIFSGADDNFSVRVWRTSDGAKLMELMGHHARVSSIVVHPDGTRIATADDDGVIIVWGVGSE
jgi:WD40 repeat protein